MKTKLLKILPGIIALSLFMASLSWAGQVVTNDIKIWAKKALEQEKALKAKTVLPNSVAVLYFKNNTSLSKFNLLRKGLTLMLLTDLSKVKEIQLVERVKLQALLDEMKLGTSGLIRAGDSPRIGKLLAVENLIGGNILKEKLDQFNFKSNLLRVPTEKVLGQAGARGKLLAGLFAMEKDLLFKIVKQLKIHLTPKMKTELEKPLSMNVKALLYLFQAIDYSDHENYSLAFKYYQKALEEDPNLELAQAAIQELIDLGLIPSWAAEVYSSPSIIKELAAIRSLSSLPPEDVPPPDTPTRGDVLVSWEVGTDGSDENPPAQFDAFTHIQSDITADMVVDLDGIKDDINNSTEDDAKLQEGKYIPGDFNSSGTWTAEQFTYWSQENSGLQIVGGGDTPLDFIKDETLSKINADGFLAYAVQLEEDRMNEKILQMHLDAASEQSVKDSINTVLEHADLRERDAWFEQKADAQAGRVLRDKSGNWVRVQQYILRPNADSVQMLNVSLRGGTGDLAGLSTMNWETTFKSNFTGDLKSLPWSDWLNILQVDSGKTIRYDGNTLVKPDTMKVEFNNPGNESLAETIHFSVSALDGFGFLNQSISSEELTIANQGSEPVSYNNNYISGVMEYNVVSNPYSPSSPGGFKYMSTSGDDNIARIDFFVVGDIDTVDSNYKNGTSAVIKNFWDGLRVNEPDAYSIGNNNLEIAIDLEKKLFQKPIDVVYVPMSRMLWRTE